MYYYGTCIFRNCEIIFLIAKIIITGFSVSCHQTLTLFLIVTIKWNFKQSYGQESVHHLQYILLAKHMTATYLDSWFVLCIKSICNCQTLVSEAQHLIENSTVTSHGTHAFYYSLFPSSVIR